jgi:cephalosporin hydroxylase
MGLVRHLASGVAGFIYRPTDAIVDEYHKWYFNTYVWTKTNWMGVNCWKSAYDAIEAYEQEFPNGYTHDRGRENKFGWTFAPNGFLIRR